MPTSYRAYGVWSHPPYRRGATGASRARSVDATAHAPLGQPGHPGGRHCYPTRFSTRSVTTPGSAKVDVSPRLSVSFAAILRRIRRMILPLRVFGSPGAHWI